MIKPIILIFLLITIGCKENNSISKEAEKLNSQNSDLEEAFQLVLDVPEFQMWFHEEIPERTPLKLIKTEFVSDQYNLKKFGEGVRIVDSIDIKQEGINDAILIEIRDAEKDTLTFSLYHHIEGAHMSGQLFKQNGKWKIRVNKIFEE